MKPQPFLAIKSQVISLDGIAQRYGKLPSEVLGTSLFDYRLNMAVAKAGLEYEVKLKQDALRRARGR